MEYKILVIKAKDPNFSDAMMVRENVFVDEQNVPPELEADAFDSDAVHVVLMNAFGPVATGRYYADPENSRLARLGRVAVLKDYRGNGLGNVVLGELLRLIRAEARFTRVDIHAQASVLGLYAKFGFVKKGGEFFEAGIPHYEMFLDL